MKAVAPLFVLLLFAFGGWSQDPEGLLRIDPVSATSATLNRLGTRHNHLQPLNPFLDRRAVAHTADSIASDTAQHVRYRLEPVGEFALGASAYPNPGLASFGGAGVQTALYYKNRFYVRAAYQLAHQFFPDHLEVQREETGTISGFGRAFALGQAHAAHYYTGAFGLRMGDHFSVETGREKSFWGDGYRSLMLSNNAAPYGFLRLTTQVWHLKYVNLWGRMTHFDRFSGDRRLKYTAMHALSWDITPRFNATVYEAVVWQANDVAVDRGFDFAYLNPLIFYRPIEFSKGSADNVLLGLSLSLDVGKRSRLYGQLYFDEILIDELRSDRQWWGNKFAVQLGYKAWDLPVRGHQWLTEVNLVRPFTYTHGSVIQAYSHANQSLAHPLGANFAEWVTRYTIDRGKTVFNATLAFSRFADDPAGLNYGNDILKSYAGPTRIYGNEWFQGDQSNMLYTEADMLWPFEIGNARFFTQLGIRAVKNDFDSPFDGWLIAGFRTNIVRPYRDY